MENVITINLAESIKQREVIASQASAALVTAECYEIDCPELYESAGEELKAIKAMRKRIDDLRKPITRNLDAVKRSVMDLFRPTEEALEKAERAIKSAMVKWSTEQERKRLQEEARQREFIRQEQERLRQEAEKQKAEGHVEMAEAIEQTAELLPTPIVEVPTPKVSGVNYRTVWRAEVVDKAALIKAVAEGLVPDAAIKVDEAFLNTQARALKSALNYPGVKAVSEKQIASRSSVEAA